MGFGESEVGKEHRQFYYKCCVYDYSCEGGNVELWVRYDRDVKW